MFGVGRQYRNNSRLKQIIKKNETEILINNKNDKVTNSNFSNHMSRYAGKTVTIFTSSGGMAGAGFTGILINANNIFAQLVTKVGPPPACFPGSTGLYPSIIRRHYFNRFANSFVSTVGCITYIKMDRIVSFVHSVV